MSWSFGPTVHFVHGEDGKPPDKGSRWSYNCPYCFVNTHSPVLERFTTPGSSFIRMPSFEMQLCSIILQCTCCRGVVLVLWPYGEDISSGQGMTTRPMILPFPQAAREVFGSDDQSIPAAILEDLRQAELAFQVGAVFGAGLLLRRAIQYVCRDKACKGKDLREEIDALAPPYITNDMANIAHSIRIVGNELAHPNAQTPAAITSQDIKDCWEFIIELIKVIYIHPARQSALLNRVKPSPKKEN